MTELPDKTVAEVKTLELNYAPGLTAGVTISAPTFSKSCFRTDAGAIPDAVTADALQITTNQVVVQTVLVLIGAGLEGNHYRVVGHAPCSDGQVLDNAVVFAVRDSAA